MGESETEPTGKPFPGYDFDTFDGCVAAMGDEVDDPEGFCSWLEEEGKEALSDPNAQDVLSTLEVEFVSPVDTPAQDSEWVIAKNAEDPDGETHRWQSEATLYVRKRDESKDDDVKQIAFAPVLIPKEADKQGDVIPAPAIEDAAHKYLAEYRKVDSDHDLRDGKGKPVESWTLKQDTTFEKPDGTESRTYPEGTWVMGIKFEDETWERVEAGELNGLSIFGGAKPVDVDALLGKGIDDANKSEDGDTDGDTDGDADGDVDDQSMKNEDDPGDNAGNGDGESVEKQLDAGAVSEMLATIGEKDGVSGDTSITDFVKTLIQDGDVDDSEVRNMSVLLDGGSGGGSPDEGADDGGDDGEDGDDDGGISMSDDEDGDEAGKSDDGDTDDVDKGDDGDGDEDDVEKSVDDFDDAPGWAKALKSEVDALRDKVEGNGRRSDKMEQADELSDRIVKDITGHDDADVARKAIREQVEKSGDEGPSVDYDGITDDEGADADASGSGSGSLHSSAANTRMVGGDN